VDNKGQGHSMDVQSTFPFSIRVAGFWQVMCKLTSVGLPHPTWSVDTDPHVVLLAKL